ncbi:MAG TPA: nuclear transport factor 2 family protein [Puia sp.]|nr:nuclear transport factor 2 family protein [Puia sp.]
MNQQEETTRIKTLLADQAQAIRNRDTSAAIQNYAQDVLIFDVIGPLAHPRGIASVEERLARWLSTFAYDAPINFELVDVAITADENLAFSNSCNHVNVRLRTGRVLDMYWRETLNWRKENGEWKIVHAHSSVPFDPATGMAATGLRPVR